MEKRDGQVKYQRGKTSGAVRQKEKSGRTKKI